MTDEVVQKLEILQEAADKFESKIRRAKVVAKMLAAGKKPDHSQFPDLVAAAVEAWVELKALVEQGIA